MSERLLSLVGIMTPRAARAAGFTNHGKYYGIPLWIGGMDDEALMVATKWAVLEPVFTLASYLEAFMVPMLYPDDEPAFMFRVGPRIEGSL